MLVHHGGGRFSLSPEGEAVLANEDHPAFGAGFFSQLPSLVGVGERLPEAFRTGIGLPYDAFGPEGARGIERGLAPWFRALLVPMVLPRVGDVAKRLRAGVGSGRRRLRRAASRCSRWRRPSRSPSSTATTSRSTRSRAPRRTASAAGVTNASFHDAARDPLPADARFAFVTTFDCLHDMTDPASVMRRIRGAWRPTAPG